MQKTTPRITDILGKTYDKEFFRTKAPQYRKILLKKDILIFPGFLNPKSVDQIQREAAELKPQAFASSASYNVYVLPDDPAFPPDHPRNRPFQTTKKCIPDDLIPQDSCLRTLYDASLIRNFLCRLLDVPALFPYADPLSSININYYQPGDALEWHFDNSDFTITLLGKKSDKGGDFEYLTNVRKSKNGDEDYELVRKILDGEKRPLQESMETGDLMIFRGNQSLHRVTEVLEGERILITFNFNTAPGIPLSENSRQTFFGRVK